ncbi:hypothetical protein G9274_002453 [Stenotrophomonas rhizophila]|nr:hypothetical protein G9274_002453 [Stenotrophomonas rhizophila]
MVLFCDGVEALHINVLDVTHILSEDIDRVARSDAVVVRSTKEGRFCTLLHGFQGGLFDEIDRFAKSSKAGELLNGA